MNLSALQMKCILSHLTNQVDGGLHLAQLIVLSIKETQDAVSQSADLIRHTCQRLGGKVFGFLQGLLGVFTRLLETLDRY